MMNFPEGLQNLNPEASMLELDVFDALEAAAMHIQDEIMAEVRELSEHLPELTVGEVNKPNGTEKLVVPGIILDQQRSDGDYAYYQDVVLTDEGLFKCGDYTTSPSRGGVRQYQLDWDRKKSGQLLWLVYGQKAAEELRKLRSVVPSKAVAAS